MNILSLDKLYQCEQQVNTLQTVMGEFVKIQKLESDMAKVRNEFSNEFQKWVKDTDLQDTGIKIEQHIAELKTKIDTEFRSFDRFEVSSYFYNSSLGDLILLLISTGLKLLHRKP